MNVYTSYFSNRRNFPDNFEVFSIVQYAPKWSKYRNIKDFAPSATLLRDYKRGDVTDKEYTIRYMLEMSRIDIESILKSIKSDNVIFVCYEKPNEFCHRHILRNILKRYGINAMEL